MKANARNDFFLIYERIKSTKIKKIFIEYLLYFYTNVLRYNSVCFARYVGFIRFDTILCFGASHLSYISLRGSTIQNLWNDIGF